MQKMQQRKSLKNILTFVLCVSVVFTLLCTMPAFVSAEVHPFWQDFGDTFLENIPVFGGDYLHAHRDTTLMSFYPVEDWEIQVCSRDISEQKTKSDSASTIEPQLWYDDVTVALSASKYSYSSNNTLYYFDWYIQSYRTLESGDTIKYSLYLKDATGTKFYPDSYKNVLLDPFQGSTGAFSNYYALNYTIVGIEYQQSHKDMEHVETKIVYDDAVKYGNSATN